MPAVRSFVFNKKMGLTALFLTIAFLVVMNGLVHAHVVKAATQGLSTGLLTGPVNRSNNTVDLTVWIGSDQTLGTAFVDFVDCNWAYMYVQLHARPRHMAANVESLTPVKPGTLRWKILNLPSVGKTAKLHLVFELPRKGGPNYCMQIRAAAGNQSLVITTTWDTSGIAWPVPPKK